MAYSRLLLLLIGVISAHLPEVHARNPDFWCKSVSRKRMMEMALQTDDVVGSDTLPSPVQIPCAGLNISEWTNKTLQQKRAEVLGAFRVFQDGVQSVRSQDTQQNHTTSLNRLERSIRNYLIFFNQLPKQSDDLAPHSAVENCPSQTSLKEVLKQYIMLIRGKLELLVKDLQDTVCREHRTISNKGS